VRKAWSFYIHSLANETSARFGALTGVWWVVSSGLSMTLVIGAEGGAGTRPAFYVIAASLMLPLLFTYLSEHLEMMRSIARRSQRPRDLLERADQLMGADAVPEELLAPLRASVSEADHLLKTGYATAARIAAMCAAGEIIAVDTVANGTSTTFSFAAVAVAFVATGLSAVQFKVARLRWPHAEVNATR
jgi:hypothetical protein